MHMDTTDGPTSRGGRGGRYPPRGARGGRSADQYYSQSGDRGGSNTQGYYQQPQQQQQNQPPHNMNNNNNNSYYSGSGYQHGFNQGYRGRGRGYWGGRGRQDYQQQQQSGRGGRSDGGRGRGRNTYVRPQAPNDVEVLSELKGHTKKVTCLALDQGSGQLFSGSHDGTVRVWSCITGECVSTVAVGGQVDCMLIEAGFLFVGIKNQNNTGQIHAYNMATNAQTILEGHTGSINCLAAGGDMLFSGGQDFTIRVWKFNPNTNTFDCAAILRTEHGGHAASVTALCASGPILFSGDVLGNVRIWDLTAGSVRQTLDRAHADIDLPAITAMLVWEGHLITGGLDGRIKIWEPSPASDPTASIVSNKPVYTFPELTAHGRHKKGQDLAGVICLAGVTDSSGKAVLMASYNDQKGIKLWELPTFGERGVLSDVRNARGMVGFAPGRLMMSGDEQGLVRVWRWKE